MVEWKRYGLEGPVFFLRRELDPAEADHSKRLVRVDGISTVKEVEEYLKAQVAAKSPCFVLVTGERGSGRSSVANYVLDRYRELRGINRDKFLWVRSRIVQNDDPLPTYQHWAGFLVQVLEDANLLQAETVEDFRAFSERELPPTNFVPAFQRSVTKLDRAMAPLDAALAVRVEDVPNYETLRVAFDIFDKAQTIVVFTALDTIDTRTQIVANFEKRTVPAVRQIIPLSTLEWQEVGVLIDALWRGRGAGPLPFEFVDPPPENFRQPRRTLARTLDLFDELLRLKLIHVDGNDAHPTEPRLHYSAVQLFESLQALERTRGI